MQIQATDLSVAGFGGLLQQKRVYSNQLSGLPNPVNGYNWLVESWPYLVQLEDDAIAFVHGTKFSLWFDLVGGVYVARFGAKSTLTHDVGNSLLVLRQPNGETWTFHDFDQVVYPAGAFSQYASPANQTISVDSYNVSGRITGLSRYTPSEGGVTEYFLYAYTGNDQLQSVTLQREETGQSPVDFRLVEYTYYGLGDANGSIGDLKTITRSQWNGASWEEMGTSYYRYWKSGDLNGFAHGLKFVVDEASYARLVADSYDPLTEPDGVIAQYADNYFEYDGNHRASKEIVFAGASTYTYEYTSSSHAPDYNSWAMKTLETRPDASTITVYTNFIGEVLLKQLASGSDVWIDYYQFDHAGRPILHANPSAVISYNDSFANLSVSLHASAGLIELTEYYTASGSGGAIGRIQETKVKQGSSGTPIVLRSWEYVDRTVGSNTSYFVSKETSYRNDNGTGAIDTTHSYSWYTGTFQIQEQVTTLPVVPTGQNGTNVAATRKSYFDQYGYMTWAMDERGTITRYKYNIPTGAIVQKIEDVDTSIETDAPSGWTTPVGGGLNLITDYEHDSMGRIIQVLGPTHSIAIAGTPTNVRTANWTVYEETGTENIVRTAAGYATGSAPSYTYTLVNPVNIAIRSLNGNPLQSIQATRASTSGKLLPTDTFAQSSYMRWSTRQYSDCCNLASERVYHTIPSSGAGSSGTNYNQTNFGYDSMKRRNRVVSPGGTISRTVYDSRSLVVSQWVGTNDTGATSSDPTGGGAIGNNMVILTANQYDGGNDGGDGNLTQVTQYASDLDTRTTSFQYDFRNRQTVIDGEIDFYQVHVYDNLNRVVQTNRQDTNSGGNLVSSNETKFDNRGRVYQTVRYAVDRSTGSVTGSQVFDTTYDQGMNVLRQEPSGSSEYQEFEFDSLGRRISSSDPLGNTTEYAYDNAGNQISTTDPMNGVWVSGFDGIGRLVRSTNPLNESTTYGYNSAGYQNTVTNALSQTNTTYFDAAGRVVSVSDPLNQVTSYTYDPNGNQVSVTDPNNLTTDSEYNERNWVVKVTDPEGHETEFGYNRLGEKISQTDALGNETTFDFDSLGRMVSTTDPLSYTTSFAWDVLGLQESITDAQSQTTSYIYDDYGRLFQTIWPDHSPGTVPGNQNYGITERAYDSLNRVLRTTDQLGDTITFNYDSAGRLTSKDYRTLANSPSGTISDSDTFTYDDNSNMLTAVSGRYSNTVTLTYDSANRKSSESLTIAGETYTCETDYDSAGRVSKLTYPDSTEINRSYTARGQLYTIALGVTTIDTRSYDNGGRLTGSSYNNGVSESRTYNDDSTVATIQFSGAAIGNLSYTWDANHNKTSESISGVMSGYGFTATYDDDNRLITWDRADTNLDQSWNLSAVGNWNSFTENASTQNRTHSAANELLTAAGETAQYDPKGNTTLLPSVLSGLPYANSSFTWDFDNRLKAADINNDGTNDVFYLWDALGRRVGRTASGSTTIYVQNGQQTVADYASGAVAGSPTFTYLWGEYIDELVLRTGGAGNHYFHRNQQFSITAVTTSSGSVAERYAYTAYGQPTILDGSGSVLSSSAINNRYTYTGREWDQTLGLYHFRARWMSGLAGRFMGRDPIGYEGSPYNLYEFLDSLPVNFLDPTGHACMVYTTCFNSGQERLDWRTVRCNYRCVIDTSRGGKGGDPPGTRTIGVGGVSCRDPRISKVPLVARDNVTDFYKKCECVPYLDDQLLIDEWTNPLTDCSRKQCHEEFADRIAAMGHTCKILTGQLKAICNAAIKAEEILAQEICNQCKNP